MFLSSTVKGQEIKDTVLIGRLEFKVNTTNVIENETYEHFTNEVLPLIKERRHLISSIIIVGSASPEGNKKRNLYLEKVRAEKMYSYIDGIVDKEKVFIMNSSEIFLHTSKCKEDDWNARRGTFIEVWFNGETIKEIRDTLIVEKERVDTVYCHSVDTVYIKQYPTLIPILGVKTNLVADALITPNVQAELYTHLWGLSLEFDYTFPWYHKDYDTYFYYQLLNGTVGIRKYLKKDYTGHYFGIYANTAIYDLCPADKDLGWQGELYGAGISYGYVFQNKKYSRLKFEPYIRIGWFNTRFDEYHASQPWDEKYYYNWYKRASDFVPRCLKMDYFGPTEIGINFTFDIVCLRKY